MNVYAQYTYLIGFNNFEPNNSYSTNIRIRSVIFVHFRI